MNSFIIGLCKQADYVNSLRVHGRTVQVGVYNNYQNKAIKLNLITYVISFIINFQNSNLKCLLESKFIVKLRIFRKHEKRIIRTYQYWEATDVCIDSAIEKKVK